MLLCHVFSASPRSTKVKFLSGKKDDILPIIYDTNKAAKNQFRKGLDYKYLS